MNEDCHDEDCQDERASYMLPSLGVVVCFDGFTIEFPTHRREFDDLSTPMQREIIKALLGGALQLVEAAE